MCFILIKSSPHFPLQVLQGPFSKIPLHSVNYKVRKKIQGYDPMKDDRLYYVSSKCLLTLGSWMPGSMEQAEVKSRK